MPKVLIAVPTAEYARQAIFYDYFNLLRKDVGTVITFSHGQSPARNRNLMIMQALEMYCTHIFFLDDDVAFEPDALERLIKHDVSIVTGLYLMRAFPHQPIIFDYANKAGLCRHLYPKPNQTGLVEVVATGLGCCLIKTEIFRRMERPWIRLGELEQDHWSDDIGFFKRVREARVPIHCDLDVKVGHMGTVTVWPKYIDGKWHVAYDTHGTAGVTIPMPGPSKEEENASAREIGNHQLQA